MSAKSHIRDTGAGGENTCGTAGSGGHIVTAGQCCDVLIKSRTLFCCRIFRGGMAGYHRVEQGECFSSLAKRYGFADYRSIYNHPNNSQLKQARPNPDLLHPGDEIYIPDRELKEVTCVTEQRHRFLMRRPHVVLRLGLTQHSHQPGESDSPANSSRSDERGSVSERNPPERCDQSYANKRYELQVGNHTYQGRTDARGCLEQQIPADAREAKLILWLTDDPAEGSVQSFPLRIGYLDPVEEISGVQGRLANFGFDCGGITGVLDEPTREGLRSFQSKFGLRITGEPDDATRRKLKQLSEER